MKYGKTFVCILTVLLAVQTPVIAQTLRFKILKGDRHIGHITAQKEINDSKTTYTITSKASVTMVAKFERETFMEVNYIGDELESSNVMETLNEDLKNHRITRRQGSEYLCLKNQEEEGFRINKQIKFSAGMLYFMEPKDLTHVFAEGCQEFCPIELIKPGIYKLSLPQGKFNHYVYQLGVLQEIRIFRSLINLVFIRE